MNYTCSKQTPYSITRETIIAEAVRKAGGGVDVVLDHQLNEYLQFDATVVDVG